jgi:predicted dehydrogenase
MPRIVIVGSGSAGRRHARNLHALGATIECFDPRPDRLETVSKELRVEAVHSVFDAVLERANKYDGAVIASPPVFHVEQATAFLKKKVPVLLEKPLSTGLADAEPLEKIVRESGVPLLLGYTYRWWPPFCELRRRLIAGVIGLARHARLVMSAHLADWHPWERYQDFFMASGELGGGALLDESHFLDLMIWLFGRPSAVAGRVDHLSSLEITSDDNVDAIAEYEGGLRVTIHLDLYGRPHDRSVTVVGEQGTLQSTFDPNLLRQSADAAGKWRTTTFECERNDMFVAVATEFLDVMNGNKEPTCTASDGVEVLRLVEMLRTSTRERRTVVCQT